MWRLSRYVLLEILSPFGAALLFFLLLLFSMAFLRGSDLLLGSAIRLRDLAEIGFFVLPQFFIQAIPIAFLLALLLGIGRMNEDREIRAMQALGLSPMRASWGVIGFGLVLSLLLTGALAYALPWSTRNLWHVTSELLKRNLRGDIKSGVFYDQLTRYVLFVGEVDRQNWKRLWLYDTREEDSLGLLNAKEGRLELPEGEEAIWLHLKEGEIHDIHNDSAAVAYPWARFEEGRLRLELGRGYFQRNSLGRAMDEYTLGDLQRFSKEAGERGDERGALRFHVAWHWRLAQGLAPLVFSILGLAIALKYLKGNKAMGGLMTLVAYVAYYILARVGVSMAEEGLWAAAFGAQLANVVFLAVGLVGWRHLEAGRLL
ncbi:MAG: LptF/LptG family permease [Cystobacterineae bacterium]|nr:LptF/LptG family permease [Cystobacterineae bacterium]